MTLGGIGEVATTFQFNGPIDLNGHDLTLFNRYDGRFEVRSQITGQGNVSVVNDDAFMGTPTSVFGGALANTFTGTLTVDRYRPGALPCRVLFDKPGGNVVNNRLVIGDGCEVTLQRADQIGDDAAVSITGGGRLQGIGTVGLIEILGATATVAPGASSGILTCSNFNLGAVNRGILQVELNGTSPGAGYDQINARGNVRLTGLTLQGSLGFASSVGQQFTIINNDGIDLVVGTFDGLPQNANFHISGESFTINYAGGTGNDVVLTRVPTPLCRCSRFSACRPHPCVCSGRPTPPASRCNPTPT